MTEADLFVGIGCMAWMFQMSRGDEVPRTTTIQTPLSENNPIIQRPLTPPSDMDESDDDGRHDTSVHATPFTPTKFPADILTPPPSRRASRDSSPKAMPSVEGYTQSGPQPCSSGSHEDAVAESEQPRGLHPSTLNFTKLLIAKPLPFDLRLTVRDPIKAAGVLDQYARLRDEGEFPDEECFWTGGVEGDQQFGWGKV